MCSESSVLIGPEDRRPDLNSDQEFDKEMAMNCIVCSFVYALSVQGMCKLSPKSIRRKDFGSKSYEQLTSNIRASD